MLAILVTPTIPNINNRKKVGKWSAVGREAGAYGFLINFRIYLLREKQERMEGGSIRASSGYRANRLQGPSIDFIAI